MVATRRSARVKEARAKEANAVEPVHSSPVPLNEPKDSFISPSKVYSPAVVSPALGEVSAAKSASPPLQQAVAESPSGQLSPLPKSRKRSSESPIFSPVTPSKKSKLAHDEEPVNSVEGVAAAPKSSSPPFDSAVKDAELSPLLKSVEDSPAAPKSPSPHFDSAVKDAELSPIPKSRKRSSESPAPSPVTPKKTKVAHDGEPVKSVEDAGPAINAPSPAVETTPVQTPRKASGSPPDGYPSPPDVQASPLDKKTWQGFCEIESDPMYFSVMIREMGVKGISFREIISMDEFTLMALPRPVHGLIFLFQHRALDDEQDEPECPEDVWFANQMPNQNSCATLAMLNILMNAKDVELGENLQQFKDFTADLTPYLRGQEIAHFEFVKTIHNSFAKKMDMLQTDLQLKADHDRGKQKARGRAKKSPTPPEEQEANHFIAFLPINGKVWKLDGMEKVPTLVAEYDEGANNWLDIAIARIQAIMDEGNSPEYALFAMVQSPLVELRRELCENAKKLEAIEGRLASINEDWEQFIASDGGDSPVRLPEDLTNFGVPEEVLSTTVIEEFARSIANEGWDELVSCRAALLSQNRHQQADIMAGMEEEEEENRKAAERRWDYGPVISNWIKKLAENGFLAEHIDEFLDKN